MDARLSQNARRYSPNTLLNYAETLCPSIARIVSAKYNWHLNITATLIANCPARLLIFYCNFVIARHCPRLRRRNAAYREFNLRKNLTSQSVNDGPTKLCAHFCLHTMCSRIRANRCAHDVSQSSWLTDAPAPFDFFANSLSDTRCRIRSRSN
jgi:hypothetical protein